MFPVNRRFLTVVLWTFVLLLTSCQQEGAVEKAGRKVDKTVEQADKQPDNPGAAISSKGERAAVTLDDFAVTAKIREEFSSDPLLKIAQLEVTTIGGVVILSGFVNSQKAVDRAQDIVRSIKEVKSIESRLLIQRY
jgi:hyperosmotically inducible periplasmic protein